MLLIEKLLMLKSSEIFNNIPEQELIGLAEILEEVYVDAGVTIFHKGDIGKCMYIIFKGKLRIHDGDITIGMLEENEVVGWLSLLDGKEHPASATTTEEAILLKLDQEPFYEIMMTNPEVLKGILNALCQRIRFMVGQNISLQQPTPESQLTLL
ncbi:Crp/Fnr family transcriptional regulator [Pontibacter ruber]|uniref:Crp/Fnr family transcriptional regulator n=1 Tax=Pontibacter ruber TaxID=1343895 RepID=A0ABW5D1W6_9BACT|nr:cyclic nucleotide-binding domain-containing protein [Pontibacter ruber]